MTILKQNGVNGKILKSNDGNKVMKQNFNFGKSFTSFTTSVYIKSGYVVNHLQPFSILAYAEDTGAVGTESNGIFTIIDNNNDGPVVVGRYSGTNAYMLTQKSPYTGGGFAALINTPIDDLLKWLSGVSSDGTNISLIKNNSFIGSHPVNSLYQSTAVELRIGVAAPFSYSAMRGKLDRFTIYDRAVSQAEINFAYNNGLGNELLNLTGLQVNYLMDKAEVLNNGSGDFAGVRDYSGNNNRHGEIIGLPAGTVQEQVDFANANYFTLW
jgi:hypothetical protein